VKGTEFRFMASVLAALVAAGVCYAQRPAEPIVQVAVYDFIEPGGYAGHMIGRRAAEALYGLMLAQRRWEVVDREVLLRQCAAEHVAPPYAVGYLQMFGHRLDAPLALCGAVQNCIVNPQRGSAQVTLVGELTETMDGNSLQSITTVGSYVRGRGETIPLDEVVDRALTQAAEDLAAAFCNFDPVTAPVMADVAERKLLLDAGTKAGLTPRAKMLAYRQAANGWSLIAVLQVESLTEDIAHARVVAQKEDVRPNDRAVLIAR